MQTIEQFTTERLRAERVTEVHFDDLFRLWQDPRVMATHTGIRSEEESHERLRASLEHWARYGFGRWILRDKQAADFIGYVNLRTIELDGWPEVELGYTLHAECWGKGLATEAATAVVSIAFQQLGMEHLIAFSFPDNVASRRVMENVGFQYERDFVYDNITWVLYRLRRAEYLASRDSQVHEMP